jgi:quinohemoprotein ethanol dehydrogenase
MFRAPISLVRSAFLAVTTLGTALSLAACGNDTLSPPSAISSGSYGNVDYDRLDRADATPGNWYTNGRDKYGSYYSPLEQIDASNVDKLGLAWEYDLGTERGQEATPTVIDGIMYTVGNWGRVYALNAQTGAELWTYIPDVDGQFGRYTCCDVVQRGLVVWKGKVYAGSTDGYLHALDAKSGQLLWRADTLPAEARQLKQPYTSSGSPQVAGNVVVIGNGGADYGVRGFVTAFDLVTGKMAWRFYTVPRDPKLGAQEAPHLDAALKTWDPAGSWTKYGGGGTVWDGMAYDDKLGLLYIGVGNSSPYNYKDRSPKGGDNLYLASILAIKASTGELVWHFQQVPGERWDYTATQKFTLADNVEIGGKRHDVIMQAPKNGFFYVLDRATGEYLSGKPFIPLNWTKGLDAKGRPIPNPEADYEDDPKLIFPGNAGGHNWQPMARDVKTGTVFIPTYRTPQVFVNMAKRPIGFIPGLFSTYPVVPAVYESDDIKKDLGKLPPLSTLSKDAPAPTKWNSAIKAFNPLTGETLWQLDSDQIMASGITVTGSGLMFYGRQDGVLYVYESATGKLLKTIATGSSMMAAPSVYAVDGKQYVAIMTGYGGGGGFYFPPSSAAAKYGNRNRILVFTLDGGAVPIPPKKEYPPIQSPIAWNTTPKEVETGRRLFVKNCSGCHVFGPGMVPDLRRMTPDTHAIFNAIVLEGLYAPNGMARFDDILSKGDARAIHSYIIDQTRKSVGKRVTVGHSAKAQ